MSIEKQTLFRKLYNTYLPLILIIVSVVLLVVVYSGIITNDTLNNALEKVGVAILSSGVFAAVLKSIQFNGLFREEIAKVMLSDKYILAQPDSKTIELWKTLSRKIYRKRYPEITDCLEKRILDSYFPTNHSYYYKDYYVTINIIKLSPKYILEYSQAVQYKVIPDGTNDEISLEFYYTIENINNSDNSYSNLEYFKVNGVEEKLIINEYKHENLITRKYSILLRTEGLDPIEISFKFNRKYSIYSSNYKLFRTARLTKNMDVSISHPPYLNISFFDLGMVQKFENIHSDQENHIHRCHRDDVILPHQGFGLTFDFKNNNN